MKKTTKLDTLKAMLRVWKRTHGIPDASDICEFLVENLDIHHKIDVDVVNELIDKIHPEPRLKDERFRKAVRAWFNILPRLEDKRIYYEDGALWVGVYQFDCGQYDILNTWLKSGEYYTLEELCGEEE